MNVERSATSPVPMGAFEATFARLAAEGVDAGRVAEQAVATWRELDATLSPIIGQRGVDALYLFGSIARDDAREGSDVDVFIDPESDESFGFLQYMDAYDAIRRAIGGDVEIGYSTRAGLSRYVRAGIEREAIRVF